MDYDFEFLGSIVVLVFVIVMATIGVRACTDCQAKGGLLVQGKCVKVEVIP